MTAAERRRVRDRLARRRRRLKEFQELAAGQRFCPVRHGPKATCGARLLETTDRLGRVAVSCPACDRRRRGICRDCPRPVAGIVGRSLRCADCKVRFATECCTRNRVRHRDDINKRRRQQLRKRPDLRAKKNAYRKAYRLAHPEKVREWKRKEALKQDPRVLAAARLRNAELRKANAPRRRALWRQEHPAPAPTCKHCTRAIPWDTRGAGGISLGPPPRYCIFCEARVRLPRLLQKIRHWTQRADTEPVVERLPDVLAAPRVCPTKGCRNRLLAKAKRCDACKAGAQRDAEAVLRTRTLKSKERAA